MSYELCLSSDIVHLGTRAIVRPGRSHTQRGQPVSRVGRSDRTHHPHPQPHESQQVPVRVNCAACFVASVQWQSRSRLVLSAFCTDHDNDHSFSHLSVHKALNCPEGQCAWTLAPSLFGALLALCRKHVSKFPCPGLVPAAGNGGVTHSRYRVSVEHCLLFLLVFCVLLPWSSGGQLSIS